MTDSCYTVGQLIDLFRDKFPGCKLQTWQVDRVIRLKLDIVPRRAGKYRIFESGDLADIELALKEAGYLPKGKK